MSDNSFLENRYVLIMAGGIGSRFWPLSRAGKPKQFLDILATGETLIQQTFRRFKSVCREENILVVTNYDYKKLVTEQLGISADRVIAEPLRRNTAPCIAYGTMVILKENPDAVIAVTPADHLITNEDEFRKILNTGFDFARVNNALITLGIKPDKPETGYGYIQSDKYYRVNGPDNLSKVKAFTEKPDLKTAELFIESGDFYWNSGIFVWSAKSILTAVEKFLPDIYWAFMEGESILGSDSEGDFIKNTYNAIRSISIDYGVLEKADNVYVMSADMGWSDLGTWGSLYAQSETDLNQNAILRGKVFSHDASGNLISLPTGKVALLQGLNGFIVVDTGDALLVIRQEDEQNIKQYLEEINR